MVLQVLPQAIPSLLASDAGSEVSTAALMCDLDYNRAKNMLALNHFTTRDTIPPPPHPPKLTNLETKPAWGDFGTVLNNLAEKRFLIIMAFLIGTMGSIDTKLSVLHGLTCFNPSQSPGDIENICSIQRSCLSGKAGAVCLEC